MEAANTDRTAQTDEWNTSPEEAEALLAQILAEIAAGVTEHNANVAARKAAEKTRREEWERGAAERRASWEPMF